MALQGGGMEGFDPRVFDELAREFAVPGEGEGADSLKRSIEFQNILALATFAKTNPKVWDLLRIFLAEESFVFAKKCASINPTEDPMKRHGIQCFNAGAAYGLATVARMLAIPVLQKRLDKMSNVGDTGRVVYHGSE